VRPLGAAEDLLSTFDASMFPRDFPVRERAIAALTTALPKTEFTVERNAGRSLTGEQAIAAAQTVVAATDSLLPAWVL
jgi:hypothetical protein